MNLFPIILIILAVTILLIAKRRQQDAGIPPGWIIYSDTIQGDKIEDPLFDPELRLTGKPDYLVKQDNLIIPIEIKSTYVGNTAYDTHIYQVVAYCVLVEHVYGIRPPYGIIHYPNRTFAIDYSSKIESSFLTIIDEMRRKAKKPEINRSHDSSQRCARCGYRNICNQRL